MTPAERVASMPTDQLRRIVEQDIMTAPVGVGGICQWITLRAAAGAELADRLAREAAGSTPWMPAGRPA